MRLARVRSIRPLEDGFPFLRQTPEWRLDFGNVPLDCKASPRGVLRWALENERVALIWTVWPGNDYRIARCLRLGRKRVRLAELDVRRDRFSHRLIKLSSIRQLSVLGAEEHLVERSIERRAEHAGAS